MKTIGLQYIVRYKEMEKEKYRPAAWGTQVSPACRGQEKLVKSDTHAKSLLLLHGRRIFKPRTDIMSEVKWQEGSPGWNGVKPVEIKRPDTAFTGFIQGLRWCLYVNPEALRLKLNKSSHYHKAQSTAVSPLIAMETVYHYKELPYHYTMVCARGALKPLKSISQVGGGENKTGLIKAYS